MPHYVQPVIEQGVADGSIQTEYPRELSEIIIMLTNLWLNPLVLETDVGSMEKRVRFFDSMLKTWELSCWTSRWWNLIDVTAPSQIKN